MIKHVIFDFFGTISDTGTSSVDATAKILKNIGSRLDPAAFYNEWKTIKRERMDEEPFYTEKEHYARILGELFEKYGNPNFDVPRGKPRGTFLMRYSGFMTKLARRPMIDKNKCVKCGICVNHCPVPGKAVDFKNGKDKPPVYDYKKCIRCYCCQEMCPKHAISARRGLFGRKD